MIKDIFKDFIMIGYTKPVRSQRLHDNLSYPYILIRQTGRDCRIIYLYSGSSITVPGNWIDIFSGFYTHSGNELEFEYQKTKYDLDKIDKFIYYFTHFQIYLDKNLSKIDVEEFLDTILKVTEQGTTDFISWEKDEGLNLDLDQFEFSSLDKNYMI